MTSKGVKGVLSSSKFVEQTGWLETQEGDNAEVLSQNFVFSRKLISIFTGLDEAHSHYQGQLPLLKFN